jgi:hypothetical protein
VKLLACRTVAGRTFLDADFNVSCSSEEYQMWATTVAIPLLVVFTFGLPLAYFLAMYRHVRRGTLMSQRNVYGFFFSGFRKDIWWFELWNTLRKSLFTISSVIFAPSGVMMQTWAALVLLLLFLVVFSLSQPYESAFLNRLERAALSINVLTLLSGLGLFTNANAGVDAKSDELALFLTIFIMSANIFFVLNVLWTFSEYTTYLPCLKVCRRKRHDVEEGVVGGGSEPRSTQVVVPTTSQEALSNASFKMQQRLRDTANKTLMNNLKDRLNDKLKNSNKNGARSSLNRKRLKQSLSINQIKQVVLHDKAATVEMNHGRSRAAAVQQILIRKKSANVRVKQRVLERRRMKKRKEVIAVVEKVEEVHLK